MLELLVVAGLVALLIVVPIVLCAAALAWIASKLTGGRGPKNIALLSSGVIPVLAAAVTAYSIATFDELGGPAAQGMLILTGCTAMLVIIGWPLGYKMALRVTRKRQS